MNYIKLLTLGVLVLSTIVSGQVEVQRLKNQAESRREKAREEAKAQIEIFRARKSSREGAIEVLEQRIDQLDSQKQGLLGLKESKGLLSISYREEFKSLQQY